MTTDYQSEGPERADESGAMRVGAIEGANAQLAASIARARALGYPVIVLGERSTEDLAAEFGEFE